MATEIKYQINGQLADNTVTKDNTEDVILVPVSIGSADGLFVVNDPSKVIFIIPVEKTIYIGKAPAGGSGSGSGGDDSGGITTRIKPYTHPV